MLSRSSSAYQPLDSHLKDNNDFDMFDENKSSSSKRRKEKDNKESNELTSIAVIANHPFR